MPAINATTLKCFESLQEAMDGKTFALRSSSTMITPFVAAIRRVKIKIRGIGPLAMRGRGRNADEKNKKMHAPGGTETKKAIFRAGLIFAIVSISCSGSFNVGLNDGGYWNSLIATDCSSRCYA